MAGPGRIPGRYNIVVRDEHELFDHQIPVLEFIEILEEDAVPDAVSVVGLEKAYNDEGTIAELRRAMDQRANDLEYQSPTIQFVVEGSLHRRGKTFDLRYENELYPLQDVFGSQIERQEGGAWLVTPF